MEYGKHNMHIQSGPEKTAQSLIHCHFATICSWVMQHNW